MAGGLGGSPWERPFTGGLGESAGEAGGNVPNLGGTPQPCAA
jgi:hypothetical protein